MKMLNRWILPVVMALCGMVFFITVATTITLNTRALYVHDMKKYELAQLTGYSEEEILQNYDQLIDYNFLYNDEELLTLPTLPQSDNARIHFMEVKKIFVNFQIAGLVTLGLLVFYYGISQMSKWRNQNKARWLSKGSKEELAAKAVRDRMARSLKLTGLFSVIIPAVFGGAIALNWDWAFVTFHHIMFDNDYWIFDYRTDPIIDMLPDEYFMHCAIMIIAIVVVASVICYLIGKKIATKLASEE